MIRPLLLLAALVVGVGCLGEAPHDNPFDPDSQQYASTAEVSGTVSGIYPPFRGIAGVRVRLMPLGASGVERVATTDASGAFTVADVPAGPEGTRYLVRAEGDGLRADDQEVTVEAGVTAQVALRLDALPVVSAQSARTVHIERWFPDAPLYLLEVDATVTDPDRDTDISAVALVIEELGFRAPLAETTPGQFRATFDAETLPGGQVQGLFGTPAPDRGHRHRRQRQPGPAARAGPRDRPDAADGGAPGAGGDRPEPTGAGVAAVPDPVPVHLPRRRQPGRRGRHPEPGRERPGIDPATTRYQVQQTLRPGDYYWTVWVVDEAGNRSRSKEAGFRVR